MCVLHGTHYRYDLGNKRQRGVVHQELSTPTCEYNAKFKQVSSSKLKWREMWFLERGSGDAPIWKYKYTSKNMLFKWSLKSPYCEIKLLQVIDGLESTYVYISGDYDLGIWIFRPLSHPHSISLVCLVLDYGRRKYSGSSFPSNSVTRFIYLALIKRDFIHCRKF